MAEITNVVWMPTASENFRNIISNLYDSSKLYATEWTQELEMKL